MKDKILVIKQVKLNKKTNNVPKYFSKVHVQLEFLNKHH